MRSRRTRPVEKQEAEVVEESSLTKENNIEPNTQPTQSGARMPHGLNGVRERARKNKQERFTALLHHVIVDLLAGRASRMH